MHTPKELGAALRELRVQDGLSQRDLTEALGVSHRYIWELEQGKSGKVTGRIFAVLRLLKGRMVLEGGAGRAYRCTTRRRDGALTLGAITPAL